MNFSPLLSLAALLLVAGCWGLQFEVGISDTDKGNGNVQVGRFELFEGVVHLAQSDLEKDENLYDTFFEVAVTPPHDSPFGTGGDGQNKSVLAFCANDDRSHAAWHFRVYPDTVGSWTYNLKFPNGSTASGTFECIDSDRTGGVTHHADHSQRLQFQNGDPYFLVGLEADWVFALGLRDNDTSTTAPFSIEQFLDHLLSYGFNHLMLNIYANHSNWNENMSPYPHAPRLSPPPRAPWQSLEDQTLLDLQFFDNWDRVMAALEKRRQVAHLMLSVGNKNVQWPDIDSPADNLYWTYVMARIGQHPSVVLDVSKEAGSYHPFSISVAQRRLQTIHQLNPHQRLLTSHSGMHWSNTCENDLQKDPNATPHTTLCSMQVHHTPHNDTYWYHYLLNKTKLYPNLPLVNVEYMYEAGDLRACNGSAGHDCMSSPADVDVMRQVMWDQTMAGGYSVWYNCDSAWDVITMGGSTGFDYVKQLSLFWTGSGAPNFANITPCEGRVNSNTCFATLLASSCVADADPSEMVVHTRCTDGFTISLISIHAADSCTVSGYYYDPSSGARADFQPSNFNVTSDHIDFTGTPLNGTDQVAHIRLSCKSTTTLASAKPASAVDRGQVTNRLAADVAVAVARRAINNSDPIGVALFSLWGYGQSILLDAMMLGVEIITDTSSDVKGEAASTSPMDFVLDEWVNPVMDHYLFTANAPAYNLTHNEPLSRLWIGTAIGDRAGLYPHAYLRRMQLYANHPSLAPEGYNATLDLIVARSVVDDYILPWKVRWTDGTISRDICGTIPWRIDGKHEYIWGDDGYMGLTLPSRFAAAGLDDANGTYAAFAYHQHQLLVSHLRDESDETVYFHGRNALTGEPSCCKWGRANGWAMMMHAEVLDGLKRCTQSWAAAAEKDVVDTFTQHATALAAAQNKTDGRWHQLVNDTSTFLETSVTGMTIVALVKGVQGGWLNKTVFDPVIQLAWTGLQRAIHEDGYVVDICDGFGLHRSPKDYEGCTRDYNLSSPGLGSVLKAAVLMHIYLQD